MRIGELAERSGVSVRSLRYYEQQGLMSPWRDAIGHRRFTDDDVDRVVAIQELYAAGFCSTVVRELLPGVLAAESRDLTAVDAHLAAARDRLLRELRLVEGELQVLAQVRARLGLAPDTRVRADPEAHDDDATTTAPADHRDHRLR